MNFTYQGYRELLRRLGTRGYVFASFPAAQGLLRQGRRFVLLRHDVDFDLESALRMAELDADSGVAATYFFLVRTEHYNVFSAEGSATVSRILDLGHHLGLHFDCAAYPPSWDVPALAAACAREVRLLADWFVRSVSIVSYHRPTDRVLSGDPALSAPLPHTYMAMFVREMRYLSDSRGEWRFGAPMDDAAFTQGRPLHILVHPVWWDDHLVPPREALARVLDRRARTLEASVARNCSVYEVR